MRGNLIDLAVGVIIGAAFNGVVKSFTDGVIMPVIGIFGGIPNFDRLSFVINGSVFKYGLFLTALVNFMITGAVIYFCDHTRQPPDGTLQTGREASCH
ncbi:MscL family protein [Deinococcus malanensis]|uniref:MscL family protein n=1 Tax=Deinococcus malanensis TaxID=1706855 RepID=UPI0036374B48